MKYLLLALSICFACIRTEAAEPITTAPPSDSQLREWSIEGHASPVEESVEDKKTTHCGVCNFYFLSRPGEKKIVAIVQDGYLLNPQRTRFNYGPIPPLKSFTEHTANVVWGCASTEIPAVRRYKLVLTNGAPFPIGSPFFIDVVFKDGQQVEKYRVELPDGRSKGWLDVK